MNSMNPFKVQVTGWQIKEAQRELTESGVKRRKLRAAGAAAWHEGWGQRCGSGEPHAYLEHSHRIIES